MTIRPRRLRNTATLRKMVRETRIDVSALIYPLFIVEGENIKKEIPSMPNQYHYSVDKLEEVLNELLTLGITSVLLFGIPDHKDPLGSEGYSDNGIIQRALRFMKEKVPQMQLITDICMCEYTSHGHCGILNDCNEVQNDETLEYLAKIALSHARAGADMVAPSDMMDGRIKAIRDALDENGYCNLPIMAYSAKYASSFYGPFREAAHSAPKFGDRKSYQMDYHNLKEGVKEALLDIKEGADIVMVKPCLSYLDVVHEIASKSSVPVAGYSVSGEYTMVKTCATAGYIDEANMICEMAVSAFRAGVDIYITYFAKEIAQYIKEGRIS